MKHGLGKITDLALGFVYEGNFEHGSKNGFGRFEYDNGAVYEGNMLDGKQVGRWKLIRDDGKVFCNDFK